MNTADLVVTVKLDPEIQAILDSVSPVVQAAYGLRAVLDAWAANVVETPSLADCRIVPGPIANPIVPKDKAMQPAITAAWAAFIAATDPPDDAGEVDDAR